MVKGVRDLGDRPNYYLDDGEDGFDSQGYVLTAGSDDNSIARASEEDVFFGVNVRSTLDETDDEVLDNDSFQQNLKQGVAVAQEGVVNVYCEEGHDYQRGDAVYMSEDEGIASKDDDPAGDGSIEPTRVGTVMRDNDLSDESSHDWVVVSITGHV